MRNVTREYYIGTVLRDIQSVHFVLAIFFTVFNVCVHSISQCTISYWLLRMFDFVQGLCFFCIFCGALSLSPARAKSRVINRCVYKV